MPNDALKTMAIVGGCFIILGLIMILWDWREKRNYYNSITSHMDAREFLDEWPPRAQFGALKVGGLISAAIGILMLIVGGVFWLIG